MYEQQWAAELAAWRIDDAILAAAPENPYTLPVEMFAPHRHSGRTPTLRLAADGLPAGGRVLDVGCGVGAASLPLGASVHGVDESERMLAAFQEEAAARSLTVRTTQGRWPDVADDVPSADVVVCAHVAYNVPDLAAFALALHGHANRRVVMEMTAVHPWVPIGPLWRHFHQQDRPHGPSAELAADVLREAGLHPELERFTREPVEVERSVLVAWTRRRLCLPQSREPEVAALLGEDPGLSVSECVTLWWDQTPA